MIWSLILQFSLVFCSNINWEDENVALRVKGNGGVPKYDFWLKAQPSQSFSVTFKQFFEGIEMDGGIKRVGPSVIALPSLDWQFSPIFSDENGNISFNITAQNSGHGNSQQFSQLLITNHIVANRTLNEDTESYEPLIKFDVLLDNYTWVSEDPTAKLILVFALKADKSGLDNTFFECNRTAISYDPSGAHPEQVIKVSLIADGDNTDDPKTASYWVIYDHFSLSSLLHDPEFGFIEEVPPVVPFSPVKILPNQIVIIVCAILISVIVLVTMVVSWLTYRKKFDYQTLN